VAVALLVAWLRFARAMNKKIRYEHMPATMAAIVKSCGLTDLLAVDQP
jgi:ABC-type transporter Mla MlaB component